MNGFLIIDKPKGITSHDVAVKVKRAINANKVGHTGTLDPFATGVLLLCINEATSTAKLFEGDIKEYIAEMKLGEETDTYDIDGRVTNTYDISCVKNEDVVSVMNGFKGKVSQTPPMFSAIKKNGVPLYKLARKGVDVEREPRDINIYGMDILEISLKFSGPYVKFRVICSKGTYIRSLCFDIGRKLGCGAHLVSLQRTRNGRFSLKDSSHIDSISVDRVITLEEMFKDIPVFFVDETSASKILNGLAPDIKNIKDACQTLAQGDMVKFIFQDRIIALGQFDGNRIKFIRVFKGDNLK